MGLVEKHIRDDSGLVILTPEVVAPETGNRPVAVKTRKQAEDLGWVFVVAEKPSVVALGGGLIQKRPGSYVAEWAGAVGTGMPTTHRRSASSLGTLLVQITEFEARHRA